MCPEATVLMEAIKTIVTLNSALWVNVVCLLASHMLNSIKLYVLLCLVAEMCLSFEKYHIAVILELYLAELLGSNITLIMYLTTLWI